MPEPSTTVPFLTSRSCGIARFLPWTRPRKPGRAWVRDGQRGARGGGRILRHFRPGRRVEDSARLRGVDSGKAAVVDGHLSAALIEHELVVRDVDERAGEGGAGVHDREGHAAALVAEGLGHPELRHRVAQIIHLLDHAETWNGRAAMDGRG